MDKLPISLVIITCNEAQNIERCLKAADFCAESLVVDSGSTDRTLEIAQQCGARILHREWTGYRDQKNFGTEQATQDWVLCIDADEVVSPELRTSIRAEFVKGATADAYEINRHSVYAGKLINHSGWYPQWRLFLYRKGTAVWAGEEPHTTVKFRGSSRKRLTGDLYHYTYANIRQHVSKNISAAHDWAVAMQRAGRKASLMDLLLRGPWSFFRAYVLSLGFLDGFYGLVIAVATSFYTFNKYAMLRELNRRSRLAGKAR
jgi:glycosyltransferase involved in cell wall biosynthesis